MTRQTDRPRKNYKGEIHDKKTGYRRSKTTTDAELKNEIAEDCEWESDKTDARDRTPVAISAERHAEQRYSNRHWHQLSHQLPHVMSDSAAILFSLMINFSDRYYDDNDRTDWQGWFYFPINHIKKLIGHSERKQSRLLKELRKNKLVSRRSRGNPPRRYFRINFKNLHNLIKRTPSAIRAIQQ